MNFGLNVLGLFAIVGSGLIAGVFFAFSSFVMKALRDLPPAAGIAAMQRINVVVINPIFMTPFLGTVVVCVALTAIAIFRWGQSSPFLLAGSALYVVGTFGVTLVFNVPRNNALESLRPDSTQAEVPWPRYVTTWTRWNHVRTVAALSAMIAFSLALQRM